MSSKDKWYADVPGVSKEDNEMVFGSDIFLEKISKGKLQVVVEFSNSDEDDAIYAFRMNQSLCLTAKYAISTQDYIQTSYCSIIQNLKIVK